MSSAQKDRLDQAAVAAGVALISADQQDVASKVMDADWFCGHAKQQQIDWQSVVAQGRLAWIQSSAAGMDHCLVPQVVDSNIEVSGCSGLFRDSVAEQTMALLYGLIRSMPVFFHAQSQREYVRRPTDDLHGKRIGIVGFGGNGQRIAQMLKPLGNSILATDRFVPQWQQANVRLPAIDHLLPADQLPYLLSRSDVLILTLPLDDSTVGLIGQEQLAALPKGAYVINVGRGKLLDETALCQALQDGHLNGAGLDVAWNEPPDQESSLWNEPGVLLSPHVGAQSARRYDLVLDLLIENMQRIQVSQRLKNRVDKTIGYSMPSERD